MSAARLYHTVRHLRPVQVWGRLWTYLPRGSADLSPAPPLRERTGSWREPIERPRSLFEDWRVRFINEEGSVSAAAHWDAPGKSKLWLYNLHYFDGLAASAHDGERFLRRRLMERWIAENPPGEGSGWEPYPLSLRLVNWIKWGLRGEPLDGPLCDSLAAQVRWLTRHIEWHLLGNHLLANAKALIFAGFFFDGPEAGSWLGQGLSIYEREISRQILPDGGHFELSPMYHAIILEDLLDVINAARTFGYGQHSLIAKFPEIILRMRAWLAVMTHPDGAPAFFNDCAFGISPSRKDLEAYASRLGLAPVTEPGEGPTHLSASGYVRVQQKDAVAICDIAPVGPSYLPGHAHADTLSFELSIGKERVIVNGGTSTYDRSPQRHLERSTRSHSTVEINGENSSEVWDGFRVARRARPFGIHVARDEECVRITAAHDGYRRLPERAVHKRSWIFVDQNLTVTDEIMSLAPCRAVARFHLGPEVCATIEADAKSGRLATAGKREISWTSNRAANIDPNVWYPEFGKSCASKTLAIRTRESHVTTIFFWT